MAAASSNCSTPASLQLPPIRTPISAMSDAFGSAIVGPLEAVLNDTVTLARLGLGNVLPLGLQALVEACAKSRRVKSVDFSGHDLTHPGLFCCVTKLIKTAPGLRMLSLAHTSITDEQLCQLQATISLHHIGALEALSIAGNRFTASAVTAFLEHFLLLPRAAVLDLCLIPKLGNHLVSFLRTQMQQGLEWRLTGLLFAYTGLTKEGLVEFEGLLRLLTGRLKYVVVSGNTDSCEEWQSVLDAPFEGALRVLPDVTSTEELSSAAVSKLADSMLTGEKQNGTLVAMFVKMYEDFLQKKEQGLVRIGPDHDIGLRGEQSGQSPVRLQHIGMGHT